MMQFDEFAKSVETNVKSLSQAEGSATATSVSWKKQSREATVALVPPLNVSVTLEGAGAPVTTWYPVDAALVSLVSNRVAGFLSEA